jgi:hypothetical protein
MDGQLAFLSGPRTVDTDAQYYAVYLSLGDSLYNILFLDQNGETR